ncbi:hypothetical protein UC34_09110 [Pandoraea vervacti]|uniref:Secreted protein n=1 Tax=Pandoraea vervacti TaxID=656178 RepID=A0ABM5SXB1_9BURK|nr:hypothetical protein UC34_09110 [Pandoraea vervacti]
MRVTMNAGITTVTSTRCLALVAVGAASRRATRAWPSSIPSVRTIVARWMRNFTTGSGCAVIECSTIAIEFAGDGG